MPASSNHSARSSIENGWKRRLSSPWTLAPLVKRTCADYSRNSETFAVTKASRSGNKTRVTSPSLNMLVSRASKNPPSACLTLDQSDTAAALPSNSPWVLMPHWGTDDGAVGRLHPRQAATSETTPAVAHARVTPIANSSTSPKVSKYPRNLGASPIISFQARSETLKPPGVEGSREGVAPRGELPRLGVSDAGKVEISCACWKETRTLAEALDPPVSLRSPTQRFYRKWWWCIQEHSQQLPLTRTPDQVGLRERARQEVFPV